MRIRLCFWTLMGVFIATPAAAEDEQPVHVHINTTKEGVTVAGITGRGAGVSSAGASVSVVSFSDLCYAPCDVEIEPGMQEFMTYGKFTRPVSKKFQFEPGESVVLESRPRSELIASAGIAMALLGIAAASYGSAFAFDNCSTQYLFGKREGQNCEERKPKGVALLGGGLGLIAGGGVVYFGFPSKLERAE